MRIETRSVTGNLRTSPTQVVKLLDDQLMLSLRSWGSADYSQKFIDEVSHYLSSTQADIEVTTPFDFLESYTSLANKLRIALLLAHDLFFKVENKNEYVVGFEVFMILQSGRELAWSSVGRFALEKISSEGRNQIFASGSDLDSEMLLPTSMLGVEPNLEINCGSIKLAESESLILSSCFNGDVNFELAENGKVQVEPTGTSWVSIINQG